MISVTADFNMADIDAYIREEEDAFNLEIFNSLRKTGRKLVDKARSKTKADGGFGNITWNLRASIGMCIVNENGKITETYFPPISKGEHGNKIGREMAEMIADLSTENEIFMVFVAGEKYAQFVQAKGKDVIKHVIGDNLEAALRAIL